MEKKYLVVIEKADKNYSAFSPDLPGCITVGGTVDETINFIKEAIELYLEAVADEGGAIPPSKGLRYYTEQGIFDDDQIAEEYYITRVEVTLPGVAA